MLKPKYKLRERPVFTFSLPGGKLSLCPSSVTPLAMVYCIYMH